MLNVLITRPENKAQQLALLLKKQGIVCANQPLFDYQPLADKQTCQKQLSNGGILIFVSAAAVNFANNCFSAEHWQYGKVLAVGSATKSALLAIGITDVITPTQENSEGLLTLPELNENISNKSIVIVRGDGGRELLADTLSKRGATVSYLESYQRLWRVLAKDISNQWYQQQINCIVVTSNAILEKLLQLIVTHSAQNNAQSQLNYWHNQCTWVVVSQRIAEKAKRLGLTNVVMCDGANDKTLCDTLRTLQIK